MPEFIRLDYESRSQFDLPSVGLDIYSRHPSTRILMAAWRCNDVGDIQFWDVTLSRTPDKELIDRLRDPSVLKWAFNAQFERLMTERVWGIKTPRSSWRCTMVLAYMMGFAGTLANVGAAMGFDASKLKDPEGKKLINMFSKPRRPTKKDPRIWYDAKTHPEEFLKFGHYNRQDVKAETAIARRLEKYPIMPGDWDLYAIDQYINDTGITIDLDFARNALAMAEARKPVIMEEMRDITGTNNPNSPAQLLKWLNQHDYPFSDLRADTVSKVLREAEERNISPEVVKVLRLRQNSSKSSLAKYVKMLRAEQVDGKFRYSIQFRGAARTGRYGGRDLQPHNMVRTPGWLEDVAMQAVARRMIMEQDMPGLEMLCDEPMDALVGMMRGALVPTAGHKFVVADLASIESVVIGWLTGCRWILDTLKQEKDLYISFASFWLKLPYEKAIAHRKKAKPATLGAGFRLGGGSMLPNGKKGGLWGYAENMGVHMTQKEAAASVKAFRNLCPEIVEFWYALEKAVARCLSLRADVKCGKLVFEFRKPFLAIKLPSGRRLYYYKPRIVPVEKRFVDVETGEERRYTQNEFRYEGMGTQKKKWGEQSSHGGKLCIAEGTKVLTDSGWKGIELVSATDKVWDGVEWVSQEGNVLNGEKEVIKAYGAWMTHDHQVLTEQGWKSASESSRYNRAACRLPDGVTVPRVERSSFPVGNRVCLREDNSYGCVGIQEIECAPSPVVMRLQENRNHRGEKRCTRNVQPSGILGLAKHDRPVFSANTPGMEKLRFQGHNSLRKVADVSTILAGYGADVSVGAFAGAHGQRQGVQSRKLLLGDYENSGAQPASGNSNYDTRRADYDSRTGRKDRDKPEYDPLPCQARLDTGTDSRSARRHTKVYDLINCGPRHRFVIATEDGPLIVHNCENIVQAIANDVLNVGIQRAFADGFRIPFHVHDEIVTEVPVNNKKQTLERLIELMTAPIDWALTLPLKAAGWEGFFYRKD